ncbi:MAG: glycosyltransferase family 1 protein [Sphingomonadaceae bacterium]
MRIALITDAWAPQVNGVVRTLTTTTKILRERGMEVLTLTPDRFTTIPCPTYPDIRLAIGCGRSLARQLAEFVPDAIHIATEGPLGWAARSWCLKRGLRFTTSFHTRFPDYLAVRTGLPARCFWPALRRFHGAAEAIFAATGTLQRELQAHGLPQTHRWSRGVDLSLFSPDAADGRFVHLPRPILLHVGRVAAEKNIGAFLSVPVSGTRVVVGDGPARARLERSYPDAVFTGALHGVELGAAYASADCLVFPSLTDTFGMVMVEALASGIPVAACPVPGPLDVVGADGLGPDGRAGARIGALDADLGAAIRMALTADREACVAEGRRYDWQNCTDQFLSGLRPLNADNLLAA